MELDLTSASYESLGERLAVLHDRMLELSPGIDRVACALYDPDDDLLKTFINSTRQGLQVLRAYDYRLSDSRSLSDLARKREVRLLTDLQHELRPTTMHSSYVVGEGFQASFTVPISHGSTFLGFVFFDSRSPDTFTPDVRRGLMLYGSVIALEIANALLAAQAIVSTMQIAQGFTALRDVETGAHLARMARYTRLMLIRLATELDLTDEFIEQVRLYAPLHDIGKIAIPDRILLKPGPLDDDEWQVMRSHTVRGGQMVAEIAADLGLPDSLDSRVLHNIVAHHHEKLDGSGYPDGLAGDDIPLESRIVAVADVFDALTSPRPYKRAWTQDEAFARLEQHGTDGTLDSRCVGALVTQPDAVAEIRTRQPDPTPTAGAGSDA
ncbi:MAG: HD-GYP domain-containing protein [Candidatus Nanopelagicales bacterium]